MIPIKSGSENLGNKNPRFWPIGLIISFSLFLVAFNWKTSDKLIMQTFQRTMDYILEEIVHVNGQKNPGPTKMERPKVVMDIIVTDYEAPVDDGFALHAGIDPLDSVPVYISMPCISEKKDSCAIEIFKVAKSSPDFPRGHTAR